MEKTEVLYQWSCGGIVVWPKDRAEAKMAADVLGMYGMDDLADALEKKFI